MSFSPVVFEPDFSFNKEDRAIKDMFEYPQEHEKAIIQHQYLTFVHFAQMNEQQKRLLFTSYLNDNTHLNKHSSKKFNFKTFFEKTTAFTKSLPLFKGKNKKKKPRAHTTRFGKWASAKIHSLDKGDDLEVLPSDEDTLCPQTTDLSSLHETTIFSNASIISTVVFTAESDIPFSNTISSDFEEDVESESLPSQEKVVEDLFKALDDLENCFNSAVTRRNEPYQNLTFREFIHKKSCEKQAITSTFTKHLQEEIASFELSCVSTDGSKLSSSCEQSVAYDLKAKTSSESSFYPFSPICPLFSSLPFNTQAVTTPPTSPNVRDSESIVESEHSPEEVWEAYYRRTRDTRSLIEVLVDRLRNGQPGFPDIDWDEGVNLRQQEKDMMDMQREMEDKARSDAWFNKTGETDLMEETLNRLRNPPKLTNIENGRLVLIERRPIVAKDQSQEA